MINKNSFFVIFLILCAMPNLAHADLEWAHTKKDEGWTETENVRKYHYSHEVQRLWIEEALRNIDAVSVAEAKRRKPIDSSAGSAINVPVPRRK